MLVYIAPTINTRVHRSSECARLRAHVKGPVEQRDLTEVKSPVLCRECFPKYPQLRVFHARCLKCKQTKPHPCPHNGAVQVLVEQRDGRTLRAPGVPQGTMIQTRWVWPENAHHHELVDTLANSEQLG